jgi:hypothetical protein
MVEYWPGIKIVLIKSVGGKVVEEVVPRPLIIDLVKKCMAAYKAEAVQLAMF